MLKFLSLQRLKSKGFRNKIIIFIGSIFVSRAYLSIDHALRKEVQNITTKLENAISRNQWGENCVITGSEKTLNICGENVDLRIAKIDDVAVTYQGGFPDEPHLMVITSDFNLGRYCIVLDGIITWGEYNAEGCRKSSKLEK